MQLVHNVSDILSLEDQFLSALLCVWVQIAFSSDLTALEFQARDVTFMELYNTSKKKKSCFYHILNVPYSWFSTDR